MADDDPVVYLIRTARQTAYQQAAKMLRDGALKLLGGKKRVNQVDRHTAEVLGEYASKIETMAEQASGN